jgi:polyisoprenoid-binding protein YceI
MGTTAKTKWVIDPAHSEIQFKVKHLVISTVTGKFDKFEGSVVSATDDFSEMEAEFSADVNSINTNQADRDGHLKSPDFFDVANHPSLTFKSTGIKKKSDSSYRLTGDLSIRGISKKIELNADFGGTVKDPWGTTKAGFELSGTISRKEFGLTWNAATETGGLVVSDEVKLIVNVELAKQA